MVLIPFKVLQEILASPEWKNRYLSAVTFDEARKVFVDYLREKGRIERFEKAEEEKTSKVVVVYCKECGEVFELVNPIKVECPINAKHKVEVLEEYEEVE